MPQLRVIKGIPFTVYDTIDEVRRSDTNGTIRVTRDFSPNHLYCGGRDCDTCRVRDFGRCSHDTLYRIFHSATIYRRSHDSIQTS